MKFVTRGRWACFCSILLLGVWSIVASAQERRPAGEIAELANGPWQGLWTSHSKESSGYVYQAELHTKLAANNIVEGHINWVLKQTPPDSHLAKKLNATATEFVKGKFDPANRLLILDGVKKDDQHEIIALDKYRLILAENNRVIGGITSSHNTWQGLISLSLKKSEK